MLQQEKPEDYVLATGETHTVREFVSEAFPTSPRCPATYILSVFSMPAPIFRFPS